MCLHDTHLYVVTHRHGLVVMQCMHACVCKVIVSNAMGSTHVSVAAHNSTSIVLLVWKLDCAITCRHVCSTETHRISPAFHDALTVSLPPCLCTMLFCVCCIVQKTFMRFSSCWCRLEHGTKSPARPHRRPSKRPKKGWWIWCALASLLTERMLETSFGGVGSLGWQERRSGTCAA